MILKLKRLFLWIIIVPLLIRHTVVYGEFQVGRDYRVLKHPVQTKVQQHQIEVDAVFWYGCPHCYSLEPIIDRWQLSLETDIKFIRIPSFLHANIWKTHAQLYYTLKTMIADDKKFHAIHDSIFKEMQNQHNPLANIEEISQFLKQLHGIDPKQFTKFYNSIDVRNLINQAGSTVLSYELTNIPVLVIDGRYVIESTVGLENMPIVADFLIKQIREERAAKAKQIGSQSGKS